MAGLKRTTCFLSVLFAFSASQETPSTSAASTTIKAQATTSTLRITSKITSSGPDLTTTAHVLSTANTSHSNTTLANNITSSVILTNESSSTGPLTISPNSSFSTLNKTSTGLPLIPFLTVTPFSNNSGLTSAHVNSSIDGQYGTDLAKNPGLVAVICIFTIVLVLLLTVVIAKSIKSKGPQFEKLDDVQMNKMSEESPFARYPPK